MNRFAIIMAAVMSLTAMQSQAALTLDECLAKAEENYPLIRRYGLVEQTAEISLSDINRSWLPRIGVYGQATVQNVVPEFPETLRGVLEQLGQDYRGLGKLQYKAGVDLTQTVWDGGASRAQRGIECAVTAEQAAALGVQIYAVRGRVTDLYFAILLMDEQMEQTRNTIALLEANRRLMQSMLDEGTAMRSDVDMIEAQILALNQQLTGAGSATEAYRRMLSIYVGEDIGRDDLTLPADEMPAAYADPDRPELSLYDAQRRLNLAREAAIGSTVMPKVGFFAQAYYGYPGINYFESMMRRRPSFNLVAGLKISWNIDSYYTKSNSRRRLSLANEGIEADRETFLFNTRLQSTAQSREIEGLKAVMADDDRIVELRANVREAAESQLRNGVIDATALLTKITDENQARLMQRYHQIQLSQTIYKLKNTLNR